MLAVAVIPAQASAEIFLSAIHTDNGDGTLSHKIQIRADVNSPDANAMLVVKKGSEYVAIDQGFADKDGKLEFTFDSDIPGTYTGSINTEKQGIREAFSYEILDSNGYIAVEQAFNGADDTNILQTIEDNKSKLLFDTKYYTNENKQTVADSLLAECGSLKGTEISEKFDKSVISSYVFGECSNDKKFEVIEYYDSTYFNLANQKTPKNLYSDFSNFKDSDIDYAFDLVEAKKPELNQFRGCVNEAAALTALARFSTEELDQFLLSNNDYVAFDGYSSYTPTKRKNIILELTTAPKASVSDYRVAYNGIIEKMNNTQKPQGGGSGGGGGGGGGGAAKPNKNVIEIPKVNQTQQTEKPEENKDENKEEKPATTVTSFNDLGSVEWARDAITSLASKGIVSGREGGSFVPNDSITRAELTAMVVNAFMRVDADASCEFTDIPQDDWSYRYIATALSKGIIFGLGDGSFGKNTKTTRQDIATIIYRVLSFTKAMPKVETVSNTITDFDEISDYAQNSVLMLSQVGIVSGFEDGSFLPAKSATRAEAAVMINRAMGVVNK